MPDKKITGNIGYRPTWAEVNLSNLAYNFRQVKKAVCRSIRVMVCVKADAYGHGLIPVAKKLAACGVDYLSVASIDEAVKLRQARIELPVLVLGMILKKDIPALFRYRLIPTVCTKDMAFALNREAGIKGRRIKIHVKVDTGMGRIGMLHKDVLEFVKGISRLKFVGMEGIFTHLACADTDKGFTCYQIGLFNRLKEQLDKLGINIPLAHAANSLGIAGYPNSHFNMVRPGLAIYGLRPKEGFGIDLKPVLSLKTRVVYFKRVPAGYGISYGHTYITGKETTIVTLPIGYGDGYPRNLSNKAPVLIGGRRFKISGRVCMDQIMVDVGNYPAKTGELAVLIGEQGKEKITAEELAGLSDTIPYEIVCGLGSRVPRLYI
ncbi:MAG: alanine racemase [Candidatus Omnitrophica bacterium]|nr:alanine racemase [Candidatus Omnitrophota bacterium]